MSKVLTQAQVEAKVQARIEKIISSIHSEWRRIFLADENDELFVDVLNCIYNYEPTYEQLCPYVDDVFNAFRFAFNRTRVVIIGQDPYPEKDLAHGLSFSVNYGKPIPPSLQNIFKCLKHNGFIDEMPTHGCLDNWAAQGILLLNTSLTTVVGKSNYHAKIWEGWTDMVIKHLSDNRSDLIFLLWGNNAQSKERFIDVNKHYVHSWIHPSPQAQATAPEHLKFINCDGFLYATEAYEAKFGRPINWNPSIHTYVYTDGACKNNGKENALAGYGIFFRTGALNNVKIWSYLPDSTHEGVKMKQTNNRAEIYAAIDALETYYYYKCIGDLTLIVDNELTLNIAMKWIDNWAKYDKIKERKNPDLLYRYKNILDKIRQRQKDLGFTFKMLHVNSHLKKKGIKIPKRGTIEYLHYLGNEIADKLAEEGVKLHEAK